MGLRKLAVAGAFLVLGCGASGPAAVAPSAPAVEIVAPEEAEETAETRLPELPAAEHDPVRPADFYLQGEPRTRFRRRALLGRTGPILWSEDWKPSATDSTEVERLDDPVEVVVVERRPRHLRFVTEGHGIRTVLYARHDDFRQATTRTTPVRLGPERPLAPGVGVRIPAGHTYEWTSRRGSAWGIEVEHDGLSFQGFVSTSDLGIVFDEAKVPDTTRVNVELGTSVELRAAPGGEVLARISSSNTIEGFAREPSKDGHRLVEVLWHPYAVTGFVSSAQIVDIEPSESGNLFGTGGLGMWGSSGRMLYLPAWTPLYPSPDGPQVGVVLKEGTKVSDGYTVEKGRRQVSFPLDPYSFPSLWIDDGAARSDQ